MMMNLFFAAALALGASPSENRAVIQKEIDAMDSQIRMLSNDRDSLEEFARENFSFAAPGDDVYIDE